MSKILLLSNYLDSKRCVCKEALALDTSLYCPCILEILLCKKLQQKYALSVYVNKQVLA